jgi:hypothetical protein
LEATRPTALSCRLQRQAEQTEMCDREKRRGDWDLDMVMPELPAQGRWRGGPMTRRLRAGSETLVWHPGDGDRAIAVGDGVATLRLEDTDLTLAQIHAAIEADPRGAAPRLGLGEIGTQDVIGRLRLGGETLRFEGLARIVIGGFSAYPSRKSG